MCRNCYVYPLVHMKQENKKKVLFNCFQKVASPEDYEELKQLKKEFVYGSHLRLSKYDYINQILDKYDVDEVIDWIQVPCGSCDECLKQRSREWSLRILLEAEKWKKNYFVTFTYDDDKLPKNYMLDKTMIASINKKLKVKLNRLGRASDFRFYGVGEYGSESARPHYHVIYFNLDINYDDLEFYKTNENGDLLYNCKILDDVWKKGFVVVGRVTLESACYVARYCDKKKRLNKLEKEHLEAKGIVPEFNAMSRRPGIAATYYDKFKNNFINEVYQLQHRDNKFSIPKYFLDKIKKEFEEEQDLMIKYNQRKDLIQDVKIRENILLYNNVGDLEKFGRQLEHDIMMHRKKRLN